MNKLADDASSSLRHWAHAPKHSLDSLRLVVVLRLKNTIFRGGIRILFPHEQGQCSKLATVTYLKRKAT